MRIFGLLKREVRAKQRRHPRAIRRRVAAELRLHRHFANDDSRNLPVLPEELRSSQHLLLGEVGCQAKDMHDVPLQNTHLAEVTAAAGTTLPLLQLLGVASPEVVLLLLPGLIVGLRMSSLGLLALVLALIGCTVAELLGLASVVPKEALRVVLPAGRTFPVHLLHYVVDAE